MGTRSTVKFYRGGKCLLALYNQYDGYYEGVGQELVDFFGNKENYGNGFEDTALLYVCHKKQGKAYNTYLTSERNIEEYNYIIEDSETGLTFSIFKESFLEDKNGDAHFVYEYPIRWASFEDFKKFIEDNSIKEVV